MLVTGTTNAETQAIRHFVARLRATFEALALKHFYSREGAELRIDATDSGLAHFSVLLELGADLKTRDADLAALPQVGELKQRMLDQIVEHSVHPRGLQRTLLWRLYLESLDQERAFSFFMPGPTARVGSEKDEPGYFWSFATYDRSLNRPFVYLLYFAWDGNDPPLDPGSKRYVEMRRVAEQCASGRINLLGFSNRLDEKLPSLRPRIVKRLILGPYHSPIFTQPEGEFGAFLGRHADRLPFAFHWETETLISERETRVGAGWLSKGQLRQVFWIPKNVELARRGVSQIERSVLMPHWLAQQVRSEGLLPDHRHLVIEESEGTHGLD